MELTRSHQSTMGDIAYRLSMSDELNDILVALYRKVTEGPRALANALKELFLAEHANIEFMERESEMQAPSNQASFQIEQHIAYMPFIDEQGGKLVLQLEFIDSDTCKQMISSTKVAAMGPHIKHALALCIDLNQQKQDLNSIEYVLRQYPLPVCIVDNHLNNIFTNQALENHLIGGRDVATPENSKPISLIARDDNNILSHCPDKKERQELKASLKRLAESREEQSYYLRLNINHEAVPIIATTTGHVPNLFRHYARENIVWIHLLNSDYSEALKKNDRFQRLGLSKTEQELSTMLFKGNSLSEISASRNVSKQTVRKQLQSTLRKTDCESQEDLIKFLFQHCLQFGLI